MLGTKIRQLDGIFCRWGVELPLIISNCISILSDGGLGMAMFSLGWYLRDSDIPTVNIGNKDIVWTLTLG